MATVRLETAAERYRRIKTEKAKGETLHDVECGECGMVWKARKVGIDFWVTSGVLPQHLVEVMLNAVEGTAKKPEDLLRTMAAKEILNSIAFAAKVVKKTAVEPRIVEDVSGPNDVSQEEVETCCFNRLLKWQMSGGEGAARLGNFPSE
jgi:hypothetical protein